MMEDHLYWAVVHARWMDDAFARGPATFFRGVPAPIRPLVLAMIRRHLRRTCMDKASAGTRLTRLLRLGRGRSSDCSFSRFQAVHDGTRADWARCYRLCLCGWHPMSTLRHTATHFGRASRESKTLRGANDRPFLPGSRRDRRMRGCGLEATNATTRRHFCRFSGAMILQGRPL